ncbi:Lsr2 family protein [Streptosporangiaceae bacterium NEAU-GS5]|nr:Lsr2 family protein [Streptosporangiaceae bacterium NEAU-GS5]
MAKQTQVLLVDDLDGSAADETLAFGLDGKAYEIDLSKDNAARLRDILGPYVTNGRRGTRTSDRSRRTSGTQRTMTREQSADIRAWARANNHPVSERGRIAAAVVSAYEATH